MKNFILLCCLCSIFACADTATTENRSATDTDKEPVAQPTNFGEPTNAEGAISFENLVEQMDTKDTVRAKVIGKVESVCQMKGCWMNIASDKANAEMFVNFKDYGFFMPKDLAGEKVVMDGYAFREVTSVEDLRHYAEDEGLPTDSIALITEPVEELKFLASGVMVMQ